MNATQQQIHIINMILDGALYEAIVIGIIYVLLSFIQHVRDHIKHSIRRVPLSNVSVDQELIHQVMADLIAHSQPTITIDDIPPIVINDTTYHPNNPESYTIRQLKVIARQQGLKGYSYMTKQELVDNLVLQ